jgi:hypothetical protein
MADQFEIAIQKAALTISLSDLALPSVNIYGQLASLPSSLFPVLYLDNMDLNNGPYLLDSVDNIQCLTALFNSNTAINSTINGVTDCDVDLDQFLYATLGVPITSNIATACFKYGTYTIGNKSYVIPPAFHTDISNGVYPTSPPASRFSTRRVRKIFNRNPPLGYGANSHQSLLGKWISQFDLIDAVIIAMNGTVPNTDPDNDNNPNTPHQDLPQEDTPCYNAAVAAGEDVNNYYTTTATITSYNIPLKLSSPITDAIGVDTDNLPFAITIPFDVSNGLFDDIISGIFTNNAEAAGFVCTFDVRVNPDSATPGPSDPTKQLIVDNANIEHKADKYYDDDFVPPGEFAERIIPAINLVNRKASDSLRIGNLTNRAVWDLGVGQWRESQPQTPEISQQLIDLGLGQWQNNEAALRRLNLIPVLSGDKILESFDGGFTFTLNPSSQVNILEAIWTQWKYLNGITETVFGVPSLTATADFFRDDPADTFIPELTGFSVIENINSLHTTVTGLSARIEQCCSSVNTGTVILPVLSALDTRYVNVTGDTMTGPLILSRDPVEDMEAVNRRWITNNYMPLSNVIPTITAVNTLRLLDSPVHPLDAVSKEYLDCKLYNFEQTFPRIPELDLRYVNLTGDHMAGVLHYSHDTDLSYGTIAANATTFKINVLFDNKTFQTIRLYRADVVYNIILDNPDNGKITTVRIINMSCKCIRVRFPPEYRRLRTYKNMIPAGYSGIFSFTAFGNRQCDIYFAYGLECTPTHDRTCNEASCDTRIGQIDITMPVSTCIPYIFTDIANTPYTIEYNKVYCFKIEDTATVVDVDGINYLQSQLVFTNVDTTTTTIKVGQAPKNSTCTFIWDIDNITGGRYKFYFGQENTYIIRNIEDQKYKITYVGMGSFIFRVEHLGLPDPIPTPTPIIYNINIGFTAINALTGTEGFNALVEVKRFEDSDTMGACKVKYRTVPGTALVDSDYIHTQGELQWYEDDYSTRTIAVPILEDTNYLDDNTYFNVELYDPEYNSSKITIYQNQVVFTLNPERANPVRVDLTDLTLDPVIDLTITGVSEISGTEGLQTAVQVKRVESSTANFACSVEYYTDSDVSTYTNVASATPYTDYTPVSGEIVWEDADYTTHTILIPISGDNITNEGTEAFTFNIRNASIIDTSNTGVVINLINDHKLVYIKDI